MDKFLVSVHSKSNSQYFALFDNGEEISLNSTTYEDAVCEADMLLYEEVPT